MNFTNRWPSLLATITLGAFFSGPLALGSVFDQADRLFEQREGNSTNVTAARAEYLRLLPSISDADLAYSVQQLGKLAVYEGTYLIPDSPENNSRKAQIFSDCRTVVAKLKNVPSQVTVYTYWRLACTALWMQYAAVADRLGRIAEVKREFDDLVDDQLEVKADRGIDVRYQGGGVYRVLAGIYADIISATIRRGLPNGAKALEMSDRALRARGYPGDVNQGTDYYNNHRYRAVALQVLRRNTEAQQGLATAINEITERLSESDLPAGMEPETKGELSLMQAMHFGILGE